MMSGSPRTLVWFREDLRLADHPALYEACQKGTVLPLYILDDETPGVWRWGGASRWWLHQSLKALQNALQEKGLPLILCRGDALTLLPQMVEEWGIQAVYWNRSLEPFCIARDRTLKALLKERGLDVRTFQGSWLFDPWSIQTQKGQPFQVFTAFWKQCQKYAPALAPLYPIPSFVAWSGSFPSDRLEDWGLVSDHPRWAEKFHAFWKPGEEGAQQRWYHFLNNQALDYAVQRDIPSQDKTSRLSPHLHWGEISPRQLWYEMQEWIDQDPSRQHAGAKFLSEVGWREFSYYLLYHFPQIIERPIQSKFQNFPWAQDYGDSLTAWQKGRTGYPLIDAGMRELWHTGTMHNRVRMVVASFLTKHLLIPWQEGARWFWDTLVDADLANNSASWQWVAGCGCDAAPYFRVFNPILQAQKFDPEGTYIKTWLPELGKLQVPDLYAPWRADSHVLHQAGVTLGSTYPRPLVDHDAARRQALDIWSTL